MGAGVAGLKEARHVGFPCHLGTISKIAERQDPVYSPVYACGNPVVQRKLEKSKESAPIGRGFEKRPP
jgi:hypothetical protein